MDARVLPCGDSAILIEVAGLAEVLALESTLRQAALPDVIDLVPAARTVLVAATSAAALAALRPRLAGLIRAATPTQPPPDGPLVTIPVRYHGPDLDEVAALTGLSAAEVIAAHTHQDWRVAFGGFAPGFAYLTGGDARLAVPRRATPRTRVPVGSVGLADTFSGVYPSPSPGGWQLIGRTDLTVWDANREPPALLRPGMRVRFKALQ